MNVRQHYTTFHQALNSLYADSLVTLADDDEYQNLQKKVGKAFDNAVKYMHGKRKYSPDMLADKQIAELIEATANVYNEPLRRIALTREIPEELTSALEQNTFTFSGFKTHHELQEASQLLRDADGGFKPFSKFLADIEQINANYNRNYLQAEYNFATASTQMAVKWKDWEQDGDEYNLQYRTAGDDRVREEHAVLNGTTLPMSDKFWDSYLPPNGWNCRCTAVQVLKDKYPESDSDSAMAQAQGITDTPKKAIFRFNPGKTMKVFPPKHPYLPKGCGNCGKTLLSYDPNSEKCRACQAIAKCVDNGTTIKNYNKHDNREEFNQQRNESKRLNKQLFKGESISKNFYTKRVYLDKDAIDALYAHTFDSDEIRAVEEIRDVLARVKGGVYEPINTNRPNYKEKLTRWGVKHFVRYDIEINGIPFELKMEAKQDKSHNKMYEHPYSLKKKRDK